MQFVCVGRSDTRLFSDLLQFDVQPLVPPSIAKKRPQERRRFGPLVIRHPRHATRNFVVFRGPALGPVVHDEKEICTVLDGAQMGGASEIVRDIERHPMALHDGPPVRGRPKTLFDDIEERFGRREGGTPGRIMC